jgi:hypothetical protein
LDSSEEIIRRLRAAGHPLAALAGQRWWWIMTGGRWRWSCGSLPALPPPLARRGWRGGAGGRRHPRPHRRPAHHRPPRHAQAAGSGAPSPPGRSTPAATCS